MDRQDTNPGSSRGHPPDLQPVTEELQKMKFRRKLIGGVDEADVWRKLEGLQQTYESVLDAQTAYYQALLDEQEIYYQKLLDGYGVPLTASGQNEEMNRGIQPGGITAGDVSASHGVQEDEIPRGGAADG